MSDPVESTAAAHSSTATKPSASAPAHLRSSLTRIVAHIGLPLLACLVVFYFFCPRFYLWRGIELGFPELYSAPEINRAREVLLQVDDPEIVIQSATNRVIYWRPLFPYLAHYLHLPRNVFLSLPFLGCIAAAALIFSILSNEFPLRRHAFYGTVSACAAGWFFVSTGWLTYNDSWIILCLIATAFVRSRAILFACCLAAPWIEERFVVLLPTCLALRSLITVDKQIRFRQVITDIAVAALGLAPYLFIRVHAYLNGADPVFSAYVEEHVAQNYPLWRYVEGAWAGLRANWVYVGLWFWLAWSYRPRWYVALAQFGMIATFATVLKMAGDLHRSASSFMPLVIAGMVLFQRRCPEKSVRLLPLIAALNLVLPASHVITVFKLPIYGFVDELNNKENNLTPLLSPQTYNALAVQLALGGRLDEAMMQFDRALQIDPDFQTARLLKAQVLIQKKEYGPAIELLDICVASRKDWHDALFYRALCRDKKNDYRGAVTDFKKAIDNAPKDWPMRADAEKRYRELRGVGITPLE